MYTLNHSTYVYSAKYAHSLHPLLHCLARLCSNLNKTLAAKIKVVEMKNIYMYFTTWIIHLNILLHLHVILYVDNGFFLKINRAVKDIYVKTKCTNRWILNPYKGAFIGSIVQSNPVVCVGAKFFSIKKKW